MHWRGLSSGLILVFSFHVYAASEYCMAVRGNGESFAAHFGPMARLVEKAGLPQAVSGGSSATVSLFFLDQIAGNKSINKQTDPAKKRKQQALLLKSVPEFFKAM